MRGRSFHNLDQREIVHKEHARNVQGTSDSDWLTEHMKLMNASPEKVQLQTTALQCLHQRLEHNASICNLIGEDTVRLLPIHLSVCVALHIHKADVRVFHAGCTALALMAFNSKALQRCLVEKGVYVLIITEMRSRSTEVEIIRAGCRTLRALSYQNANCIDILLEYDVLSILTFQLRHAYDTGVLNECVGFIAYLSSEMEEVMKRCVEGKIPQLLITIASSAHASKDLVVVIFEALAIFFTSEDDRLLRLKNVHVVGSLMAFHDTNIPIQVLGCRIMQLISRETKFLTNPHVVTQMSIFVVQAMSRFRDHPSIQTEGCVALYLLLNQHESSLTITKQLYAQIHFHEPLFYVIETRDTNDDVTVLAMETLKSLVACNESIKHELFIKAAYHSFTKCVEYLMIIGADVNTRGGGGWTALDHAVQHDNSKLVCLLLRYDVTDTKTALKLAFQQENWALAGILLRHTGYDSKRRVINWKNVNISELNPKLFLPALVQNQNENENDDIDMSVARTEQYFHEIRYKSHSFTTGMYVKNATDRSRHSVVGVEELCHPNGRDLETVSLAMIPFSTLDPRLHHGYTHAKYAKAVLLSDEDSINSDSSNEKSFNKRCLTPTIVVKDELNNTENLSAFSPRKTRFYRSRSHMSIGGAVSDVIKNTHVSSRLNKIGRVKPAEIHCQQERNDKTSKQRRSSFTKSFDTELPKTFADDERPPVLQESTTFKRSLSNGHIKLLDISVNKISDLNHFISHVELKVIHLLHYLERLDLSQNLLEEIPNALLTCLTNLTSLDLSQNKLTRFPQGIMVHQRLEHLNLSSNDIVYIEHHTITTNDALIQIDLSANKIRHFPSWMATVFPRLTKLSLLKNNIATIRSLDYPFPWLQELALAQNAINTIDETLFTNCPRLEKINLSRNKLRHLPTYIPKMSEMLHLSYINLSHNYIEETSTFHLPIFLLSVPILASIDLSYNRLTHLPQPQNWTSRQIQELNISHNKIHELNFNKDLGLMMPRLSRLNLSHNRLEMLPPEIGLLPSLSSLDISYNHRILTLPDEIGRLQNLCSFPLSGLRLCHDVAIVNGTARDIVSYFASKLKKAVPYRRFKLMLVGPAGRGKTTLSRGLNPSPPSPDNNRDTDAAGLDVTRWILHPPLKSKKQSAFSISAWDFARLEDFYSTHRYFLSPRAIYLAVYDLSRGSGESGNRDIERLTPWLLNIKAAVPDALVGFVGTHADQISADVRTNYFRTCDAQITEFCQNPGFPDIKFRAFVDSTPGGERSIEILRDAIYSTISGHTHQEELVPKQLVPKSYIDLEDMLKDAGGAVGEGRAHHPVMGRQELWQRAIERGILMSRSEFKTAIKFLNETGSLLSFEDTGCRLKDIVFTDPSWLCKLMARVVTMTAINITPQGVLSKRDSLKLFPDAHAHTDEFIEQYFKLLRKFEVVLPITNEKYIVTSKLLKIPSFDLKAFTDKLFGDPTIVVRRYVFPYFPNGFWVRLICRVIVYCDGVKNVKESAETMEQTFWRSGIYTSWSSCQSQFIISNQSSELNKSTQLDVLASTDDVGYTLLGDLIDIIDNLLDEWYPALLDPRSHCVTQFCSCHECRSNTHVHWFPLETCIQTSQESDSITCPNCGPVSLMRVAPDVMFGDLEPMLLHELHESEVGVEIGRGAFSIVFKATERDVAIKIFDENLDENPFRLLRHEVAILKQLNHPSIIRLVGVCARPRMLLLEHAPMGNLEILLKAEKEMARELQHRIILQIVEGLVYLHGKNIVYRDLKPSNILVFSLHMEKRVNVKLSDYGISQITTPLGLVANKGTLGYQAPEVLIERNEYNTEVDMFSFGATLYEVMSGGVKPFGKIPSHFEFNIAVRSHKPLQSLTAHGRPAWPDAEILAGRCLSADPDSRPSAREVLHVLQKVDFITLQNEVAICKGQSVECIAIRQLHNNNNYNNNNNNNSSSEEVEVWVGSGASGARSQLSWFKTGEQKQNIQGLMLKGRILCMTSYLDYVIIGTNERIIHVYEACAKTHAHALSALQDSILCLTLVPRDRKLVAGLANGKLAVYNADQIIKQDSPPQMFDLNKLMEISDNQSPITCIVPSPHDNSILIGFGNHVCKLNLYGNKNTLVKYWKASTKPSCFVYSIVLSTNQSLTLTSCKNDDVISVWDSTNDVIQHQIKCRQILTKYGYNVSHIDSRVLSMKIVNENALWVGCGGGHVIVLDILHHDNEEGVVLWRYTSAVRVITVASGSSVVTGGLGFRQLDHTSYSSDNNHDNNDEFGCVQVWSAELLKDKIRLDEMKKKREELAKEMRIDEIEYSPM